MKRKVSDLIFLFAAVSLGVMLILFRDAVSVAVIGALKSCVYTIIPSLFAMTVVSGAVAQSGVFKRLPKPKGLNSDVLSAFVFGNIGGYPIGAKLLSEAVDKGRLSPEEASKALSFCFGSGPAFAAGVVGAAVFGDVRYGICAMMSSVTANFVMFLVYALKNRARGGEKSIGRGGFSTKLMTDSVSSATGAMMTVCSMILFFSAVRAVLEELFPSLKNAYIASVLEISNLAALSGCKGVSLVTISVILAFGGICVHTQIISLLGGRFSVKYFYLTRPIQLALTTVFAKISEIMLTRFGAISAATKIRLSRSPSLIPIVCVCAMVFITLKEKRET